MKEKQLFTMFKSDRSPNSSRKTLRIEVFYKLLSFQILYLKTHSVSLLIRIIEFIQTS